VKFVVNEVALEAGFSSGSSVFSAQHHFANASQSSTIAPRGVRWP
jgi:hypothetical protein